MDEYNMSFPLDAQRFYKVAADLTGLKPSSVRATARIERNRTNEGKYAAGWRYKVVSKRSGVTVTALKGKK